MFLILVQDTNEDNVCSWVDCAEGPFDTYDVAESFAFAEVGTPWCIVQVMRHSSPDCEKQMRDRNSFE